jgi:hypothetical protein
MRAGRDLAHPPSPHGEGVSGWLPGWVGTAFRVAIRRRGARESDPPAPGSRGIGHLFYLDDRDRAVIPTTTRHVLVVAVRGDAFAQEADYDLTSAVGLTDQVISALPDFDGRIWFASKAGVLGTVDPVSGAVHVLDLHEGIGNSFAVDRRASTS